MDLPASARHVLRQWRSRPVTVQDAALALLIAAGASAPGMTGTGVLFGALRERELDGLGIVLVLAQCLPLVVRRRAPLACLLLVSGAFAAHQLLGYPVTFAGVGLFAALYGAGAHLTRYRRTTAAVVAGGYVALAVALHGRGSPERPLDFLTFFLALAACWVAGLWIRQRAVGEAQRRQLDVGAAVTAERARIAAELHDVVTHHVTAMVVQADAAQVLLDTAPDRAATGLSAISDTGRQALTELRNLLGVLSPAAPSRFATAPDRAPVHGRPGDLVDRVRAAGQPVELIESGRPRAVPGAPELAAHRVLQESLTNALKHAPGARTVVSVSSGADAIDVEVVTDAPTTVPTRAPGSGRGLAGLAERVQLAGGRLHSGRRDDGRFAVTAHIPTGGHR